MLKKEELSQIKNKILCIGDPHFKINNSKDTQLLHQKLEEHLKNKQDYDFIVVLGDVLDRHQTIHESPLSRATKFLKMLQKYSKVYLVVGNHDRPNNSVFLTNEHPFNALKLWNNTIIVDVPLQFEHNDQTFTFVPYVMDGRFEEALNALKGNINKEDAPKVLEAYESAPIFENKDVYQSTCIFAHQTFKGAKMGAIISEDGDDWKLSNPLVVSGHIHNYDHLQPNIIYTGTPLQHAFGDRNDKTISILRFDDNDCWNEERLDLKLPKKINKEIQYEKLKSLRIDQLVQKGHEDYLRLVIIGSTSELNTASKMTKVKNWIRKGIKVVHRDITDNLSSDIDNTAPEKRKTYEEALIENIQTYPKDKEKLLKYYNSIFR